VKSGRSKSDVHFSSNALYPSRSSGAVKVKVRSNTDCSTGSLSPLVISLQPAHRGPALPVRQPESAPQQRHRYRSTGRSDRWTAPRGGRHDGPGQKQILRPRDADLFDQLPCIGGRIGKPKPGRGDHKSSGSVCHPQNTGQRQPEPTTKARAPDCRDHRAGQITQPGLSAAHEPVIGVDRVRRAAVADHFRSGSRSARWDRC